MTTSATRTVSSATSNFWKSLRVWFWVVGLPLCLVALAALQYWRIGADAGDHVFDEQLGTFMRWIAVAAMVAGLLAAATAARGLIGSAYAGRAALRSRDTLISGFTKWQQHLPRHVGLILGLTVVGLTLVAVLELFFGFSRFDRGISGGEIKLRGAWLLMLLGLAWAAKTARSRMHSAFAPYASKPRDVLGHSVSSLEAPGLWQSVLALAQQTGALPPEHIVVGAVDSFYVTSDSIRLAPSRQLLTGQTLYMPITYLSLLQDQEVHAIVAHELAHFAGADTVYSQRFAPLYHGFALRLRALGGIDGLGSLSIAPAVRLSEHLLNQFHLAVMHWSRQREFAADAVAASVTNANAIASSLLRVSGVDAQVKIALQVFSKSGVPGTGTGTTTPITWHEALLQSRQACADAEVARLGNPGDEQSQFSIAHPTDTHPSTADRIQALGLNFDAAMIERNRQRVLIDEPQQLGQWFSQPQELEAQILGEYRQRAQSYHAEVREKFSAIADAVVPADLCVFEVKGVSIFVTGMMAFGFVFSLPVVWLMNGRYGELFGPALAWCSGIGALLATYAVLRYLGTQRPLMLLRASGLTAYGMAREVAWGDIVDWNVSLHSGTYTFRFVLDSTAEKNRRVHGNWMRLSYKAKRNCLVIKMASPKGASAEQVVQCINSHFKVLAAKRMMAIIG